MRQNGLEAAVLRASAGGTPVFGVCGGYQMLGERLKDPYNVEGGGEIAGMKLLPAEQSRLASARTVNAEAYDAYLKGSQHWINLTPGEIDTAQQYFELALKKDPNYAPAHAGLAMVWASRQQMGFTDPREAGPKAKAAALEAVALDDTNADAHTALANTLTWTDWNWAAGEREFQRAIALNPNLPDPRAFYSHLLNTVGRPKEAMIEIDRALAVDPFNVIFRCFYAVDLVYARRWDEAMTEGRAVLRTSPDNPVALAAIWYAAARKSQDKDAFAAARGTMSALYADTDVNLALERGYAQGGYAQGMRQGARALAARFNRAYANPADIASLFAEGGETAPALDWLEKGFEVRDATMPYIGLPVYDRLHSEPRFQALCRRMNLSVR
jgi:Tfp pilus assembly protein PilF